MVAFQYRFVSTVDDLIAADAIEREQRPKRLYRWAVDLVHQLERIQLYVIGAFIALAVIIFVLSSTWLDRLVLAVVAGLVPLYYYVIAPKRVEKRLRAANHASRTILLEFGKDGVSIDVANGGPVKTSWYEFTRATVTKRGILLYFQTMKVLLPQRVFDNEEERREFVKFVKQYEPGDDPL